MGFGGASVGPVLWVGCARRHCSGATPPPAGIAAVAFVDARTPFQWRPFQWMPARAVDAARHASTTAPMAGSTVRWYTSAHGCARTDRHAITTAPSTGSTIAWYTRRAAAFRSLAARCRRRGHRQRNPRCNRLKRTGGHGAARLRAAVQHGLGGASREEAAVGGEQDGWQCCDGQRHRRPPQLQPTLCRPLLLRRRRRPAAVARRRRRVLGSAMVPGGLHETPVLLHAVALMAAAARGARLAGRRRLMRAHGGRNECRRGGDHSDL